MELLNKTINKVGNWQLILLADTLCISCCNLNTMIFVTNGKGPERRNKRTDPNPDTQDHGMYNYTVKSVNWTSLRQFLFLNS